MFTQRGRLAAAFFLLLLTACTADRPAIADWQRAAQQALSIGGEQSDFLRIDKLQLGAIKALSANRYQALARVTIVFTKSSLEAAKTFTVGNPELFGRFGSSLGAMAVRGAYGVFMKGERQQRQLTLTLVRQKDGSWWPVK
ncbi:hypothetical protein [Gallaecimonas sp. GXIMD1310]|uniref:hypothetical protein n=1 Tax=Gallaecimonas sp. GXIMD1310 TaxID=3131926 RepID=UPI003247E19B